MAEALRGEGPLVSVIVPAHDAAAYVGDALESLRTQTLADIEVLVVDDGSSDATPHVVQSYVARDPRFRMLRRDVASGRPSCARNVGLRAARGTYVALLDADDVSIPTRLEESLRALRATGASIAFGDFRKFRDSDRTAFDEGHLQGQRFVERAAAYLEPAGETIFRCSPRFAVFLLTDLPAINTQTFFARREDLVAAGLFDESLVGGEDLELFVRLVDRFPAVYIDTVQTLMRLRTTSLTATQTDRCVLDAVRVRRAHLATLQPKMTVDQVHSARKVIARMLAELGYGRWVRGARASARAALAESWRTQPDPHVARTYLKAWLPRAPLLRVWSRITGTTA